MGGNEATAWFLRTTALAIIGLSTSLILSSIGVALMNAGVLPAVLLEAEGSSVDYVISPSGVIGIVSIILAALVLVWTLSAAMRLYRKGVAAQVDQAN